MDWSKCDLIETIPGKVSGAPVFKGTRLPVEAVVENVDAFMQMEGQSLDRAVQSTLECYPATPGGDAAIRAVIAFRDAHQPQLQS